MSGKSGFLGAVATGARIGMLLRAGVAAVCFIGLGVFLIVLETEDRNSGHTLMDYWPGAGAILAGVLLSALAVYAVLRAARQARMAAKAADAPPKSGGRGSCGTGSEAGAERHL